MNHFTITGFADESSAVTAEQLQVLQDNQIQHIEVRGLDGKNVSDITLEEAEEYKAMFDEAGIKVSSIGSPIGKINIKNPFDEHLELFQHVLKIARIFESPYIRMFSFFIDKDENPDEYAAKVIARWRLFLEAAEPYEEITLLHENEKEIFGDIPERCLKLLEALDTPKVRMAFDPANFVQCDVEVYPHAYVLLRNYIAYIHIKDARYSDHEVQPAGYGDGNVEKVLMQLQADDYHGFLSIEPHLANFEGFAALESDNVSGLKDTSDNVRLFHIAANALKKIIVEQLDEEWK